MNVFPFKRWLVFKCDSLIFYLQIQDKTSDVKRGITRSRMNGNCFPQSSNLLKTHIMKNYKKIKEEMEPNNIIDYLFQEKFLNTDENTDWLDQCRARRCDIILHKCIKHSDKLLDLISNSKTDDAFNCFRSVPCDTLHVLSEVIGK